MIFIDPHCHIYPCYNISAFFRSLEYRCSVRVIPHSHDSQCRIACILTERWDCHFYRALEQPEMLGLEGVRAKGCGTHIDLFFPSGFSCSVFPGSQINSSERIELLSLFVPVRVSDRQVPFRELILRISDAGGIPVINWAPGKWSGTRGEILRTALQGGIHHETFSGVYFGLTPLLPSYFPQPSLIREFPDIPCMWGSDPLPFKGEERQAGRAGLVFPSIESGSDIQGIRNALKAGNYSQITSRDHAPRVLSRLVQNEVSRRTTHPKSQ